MACEDAQDLAVLVPLEVAAAGSDGCVGALRLICVMVSGAHSADCPGERFGRKSPCLKNSPLTYA